MRKIYISLFLICSGIFAINLSAQIVAWNNNSLSGVTSASINATTNEANLNTSVLSRGSGLTATSLTGGYSSSGWNDANVATAITNNRYYQCVISASANYKVSFTTLDLKLRRTSTGPNMYLWQYSIDGTSFNNIGSSVSFTTTTTGGDVQPQINLSGISDLQNIPSGTTITLRLYAWGGSSSAGTLAFGTGNVNSLAFGGSVALASSSPTINVSPTSLTGFSTASGFTSPSQFTNVSGINLTGNISITSSGPYELSTDNSNFTTAPITLTQSSGVVNNTPIYARISASASMGSANGTITLMSSGAIDKTVSLSGNVFGLIELTTSPYIQNFNGIGSGLPSGVSVKTAATSSALGNDETFGTDPLPWNNTAGAFKNFASGNNGQGVVQPTATDRAIGLRQTGTFGDLGAAFVFQIRNSSGKINFTLDFNLQSLDASSPRITTWRVDYGFGINPASFIVPATIGDLTTGGSLFSNNPIHVDFGNALDNKSGIITIRIVALTPTSGGGTRPSTGIDDFNLTWEDPTAQTLSLSTVALNFPATNIASSSTLSYKIVSQTNLVQPILIEATAPYTISADNFTFGSSLSVAPAAAFDKIIYVRFSPLATGVYPGTITHTSDGLSPKIINLTGEGLDPAALSFNFNTCSVSSIPGSGFLSINVTGAQQWKCSQYGRNSTNGVDVNGFSGGSAQTNDAWLISPALNLNSIVNIPVLSFYSRGEFTGAKLQLYASTTYSGSGVPNIGDWTEITTANFPTPPGSATTTWTLSDNIDLTAYKTAPNVYIAFRYTSSAALNAARWSVDDIAITDQSTLLTVSPSQLNFGEVSVGSSSLGQGVSITAIGDDDLTLTPPAGYQISIDNSTFTTSPIIISKAIAEVGTSFYVRFTPLFKALKVEGNINVSSTGLNKNIVTLTGSSYPKSETFDVAAYNISFFGANSTNSATPAQIATQVANISTVMQRLNMDVIGIEEMSNDAALAQLVGNLPGYASVVSPRWSYSFNPPDPTFPPQKIGFVYNTTTMSLSEDEPPRAMFEKIYDDARLLNTGPLTINPYPSGSASSFWASGRLPFLATFNATIDGVTQKVRVIVIHAKSGGDAASYARRQFDVKVLKDSIDAYYSNDKVLLIGDYNDRVITSIYTGNPSSYLPYVIDNINYNILTLPLDQAGRTSFPSSNGLIDHIAITNELVSDYIPNSTDIEDPRVYIANHNATTASDHLPVYSRFQFCKLVCPTSITVSNTTGQCGAIVNFDASSTMSCGTVTAVPASGSFFSVGTTTVNVTASTGETCSFTVTVNDTEKPVITCPTVPAVLCYNQSGNYTIPVISATDNCGAVTYSYEITGATTRSGSSNNASGAFNTGSSIINWTVTDNNGMTNTCSTTVFVNNNISVFIPDAYALPSGTLANTVYLGYAPASTISLTAVASGGTPGYSYNWSSGSTTSSTTVGPVVTTPYTVTVKDANLCQAVANKTVTVIDIRGGNKLDKVVICHKGNSQVVDGNSITAHLAHGDMLGACPTASRSITETKIAEEITDSKLTAQVLPNPSTGYFTILIQSAKSDEKINVRITDMNGRIIEQKQNLFTNQTLKVGYTYQPGLYFVEISQGLEKTSLKLIKL